MKALVKIFILVAMTVLVGCEEDSGPSTKINFLSVHEASDSYYMHLQKGDQVSFKRITVGDWQANKQNFETYLLTTEHENFTEEQFRTDISNPGHTLYKCATDWQLAKSQYAGQTGNLTFENLECWQGEWF